MCIRGIRDQENRVSVGLLTDLQRGIGWYYGLVVKLVTLDRTI